MTVGEIVYRILGDDSQFNSVMGKVGTTASKALSAISKAALAATAAAATAVSALSKTAIESYAEYEQLAGGAKLMFGDAYDYIAEKAKTAFKDVQMSQNDYLEQVNGFAVGLKTALGGDELAAAKLADRIVTAEADIVAATGNTAENVQNAFNGIMKNNYTMLDNLQIGITPTKEGFQELIDTVNAYKAAHGEATNYTIDNLADCQNALVDYIKIQGLSGYAQAEGAKTLAGSMASMQAAWQNLLTGMADPTQDFDELISNLVDSVITVSDNLMPRIMAVLPQMAEGVTELAENILPLVPETLEKMLPSVLDGANALISALLDVLSSIADTAIPIVTENADEIIDTLLSGLVDAVPRLASSAADLCTALITAILDNADILTQGAVDVVAALAEGIGDNLDELIPAAVDAAASICSVLIDNLDLFVDAGAQLIDGLGRGIGEAVPNLLVAVEELLVQLIAKLSTGEADMEGPGVILAKGLLEGMKKGITEQSLRTDGPVGAVKKALDNIFTGGTVYGDDGHTSGLGGHRGQGRGSRSTAEDISAGSGIKELQDSLWDEADAVEEAATEYGQMSKSAAEFMAETARGNAEVIKNAEKQAAEDAKKAQEEAWGAVVSSLDDLDSELAKHNLSEGEYWEKRKDLLEANRDEESEEWWKYYDEVTAYYSKLAETEAKAAKSAAKEQESALKASVEDKFRDLETEQLEKGYDDSWLLEQERAFIETLDHNSEVYKDYNLKLLQEQKKADESAVKEVEQTAEKQKSALEKAYNSIIKSRDSLASSLNQDAGSIFSASEETDKHTGAKKKSSGIDTSAFEKKLAAKKKLTSKIAELMEKDVPDSLITELLKQDPEEALAYASQLLKDPKKLSQIKSMFKEDEGVSNVLANMVTENSEEFESLGSEAGSLFGESFAAAFRENWENAMSSVFGEDYIDTASVSVSSANAQAGRESTSAAASGGSSENVSTGTGTVKAASGGNAVYKIIDLNGSYVATVVEKENKSRKTTGGG